jgi:ribosomal protein S18 acetylase RimI-like enzyme
MKQLASGADEGLALVAEHDDAVVASVVATIDPAKQTLRLIDLRVDYDYRRQGIGSALLYRAIQEARDRELRAVVAQTRSKNVVAAQFLAKAAFELCGLDLRMHTNHDLVKEEVSLFWYASLD